MVKRSPGSPLRTRARLSVACAALGLWQGFAGGLVPRVWAQGNVLTPDAPHEVALSAPSPLPLLGPRYAPVTVDVAVTLGGYCFDGLMRRLMRRLQSESDVRLRVYPLRTDGELGAELLWAACDQKPEQCFVFLGELCGHSEWLRSPISGAAVSTVGGVREELWQAATRLGLDVSDLRIALQGHRYRRKLLALWSGAPTGATLPEVAVNGKRLSGAQLDSRVFDEIDLQRLRAQEALRKGAKLTRLYEQLREPSEEERRRDWRFPLFSRTPLREPVRPPEYVAIDTDGLPCQGPQLAPTTIVYVLQQETASSWAQTKLVFDVFGRYRDRVRLCILHAPITPSARRTSELLAQVSQVDERLFFRVMDELVEYMTRRYFISYDEMVAFLRRRGDFPKVAAAAARGRIRVQADLDQLRRLGLRSGSQVVLGGRLLFNWNAESLERELLRETRRGLLAKLRSRVPLSDGK